ncbi:hypothetical protein LP419_19855 [Massilia sp. H-1]|nr:hypothetical protein LP419_19855 [Massilia sp. H-1]
MKMRTIVVATLFALSGAAVAKTPAGGADAQYQHVQNERNRAEKMSGEGASAAQLRQAAARLEAALGYLATPDVHERATGNIFLYFRGHDVRMDLASIYAVWARRTKH